MSCNCNICNEIFPSRNSLFKHLEIHGFVNSDSEKTEKVVILIGWITDTIIDSNGWVKDGNLNNLHIESCNMVEKSIWNAINILDNKTSTSVTPIPDFFEKPKGFSRGSGSAQRASYLLSEEATCNGACDMFCFPIRKCNLGEEYWINSINDILPNHIRVLGRIALPKGAGDFHAESACSQRRYEYMLPMDIIFPKTATTLSLSSILDLTTTTDDGDDSVASLQKMRQQTWCDMDKDFPRDSEEGRKRIENFRILKVILKSMAGKHDMHNFATGGASPDETTIRRRIDRFYHLELLDILERHWAVFSISGDAFLRGQVRHMIGLVICLCRQWLPMSYFTAARSQEVVHIPAVPGAGLWLAELKYDRWEAKHDLRLNPRRKKSGSPTNSKGGIGGREARDLARVEAWRSVVIQHVAKNTAEMWSIWEVETEKKCQLYLQNWQVLCSLKDRTSLQLSSQLLEKITNEKLTIVEASKSPINSSDLEAAEATTTTSSTSISTSIRYYHDVLELLRGIDHSGEWPSSSLARQKVIETGTLVEGGGRGGSFSVGYLPPPLTQPKANDLFPELVKKCFLLEQALCPHRPPSSTIAINRHAQFRPHRDSGAGSGQSRSLIVGLGDYTGGELVVEGQALDIRYKPLEFDGWDQRHWTLPFVGDRYSLVWFTPLGAEDRSYWWWWDKDSKDSRKDANTSTTSIDNIDNNNDDNNNNSNNNDDNNNSSNNNSSNNNSSNNNDNNNVNNNNNNNNNNNTC